MSEQYAQVIEELVRADAAQNVITDVYRLADEIGRRFPELSQQEVVTFIDLALIKTWVAGAYWADPRAIAVSK